MAILNRYEILSAQDLKRETVEVEEGGGAVIVRAMRAKERDEYEAGIINRKIVAQGRRTQVEMEFNDDYFVNLKARLIVRCIIDENGERLFTNDDADWLGTKNAAAVNKVAEVAQRLSGITQEDMESLGKASEPTPIDGSSSDSLLPAGELT